MPIDLAALKAAHRLEQRYRGQELCRLACLAPSRLSHTTSKVVRCLVTFPARIKMPFAPHRGMKEVLPMVDLDLVLFDLVVRAGQPTAALLMQKYEPDPDYAGVSGISVVFHPGDDLDQLTVAAQFPHGSVSYATVQALRTALHAVGYELVLYITPNPLIPYHHTLGVTQGTIAQQRLDPVPAAALANALVVVPNPHRGTP